MFLGNFFRYVFFWCKRMHRGLCRLAIDHKDVINVHIKILKKTLENVKKREEKDSKNVS